MTADILGWPEGPCWLPETPLQAIYMYIGLQQAAPQSAWSHPGPNKFKSGQYGDKVTRNQTRGTSWKVNYHKPWHHMQLWNLQHSPVRVLAIYPGFHSQINISGYVATAAGHRQALHLMHMHLTSKPSTKQWHLNRFTDIYNSNAIIMPPFWLNNCQAVSGGGSP